MIYSDSEIARLRKVIVHRPDDGIGRVSPKRAEELLFDDIVYLPQMQAEHDIFRKILEYCIGADNVLETEQLLEESLYDLSSRKSLKNYRKITRIISVVCLLKS
jgi:arginine deiminase